MAIILNLTYRPEKIRRFKESKVNFRMNSLQLPDGLFNTSASRIKRFCLMPTEPTTKPDNLRNVQSDLPQWFVMRDLKRWNSNSPAWKVLEESGLEIFTPLHWTVTLSHGKRIRRQIPVVTDLLFIYAPKSRIDPFVAKIPTLQYRFIKNNGGQPMVVRDSDMRKFISAVSNSTSVKYYRPGEIPENLKGRQIKVVGGPLDGMEGTLLSVRGSKVKRLFVSIPGVIAAGVEITPEFIEISN